MSMGRRGLLAGLGAALCLPALIRTPGLLMPVRRLPAGLYGLQVFPSIPQGRGGVTLAAVLRGSTGAEAFFRMGLQEAFYGRSLPI